MSSADLMFNRLLCALRVKLTSWAGRLLSLWSRWRMSTMGRRVSHPSWSIIRSTAGTEPLEKCWQPLNFSRLMEGSSLTYKAFHFIILPVASHCCRLSDWPQWKSGPSSHRRAYRYGPRPNPAGASGD